MTANADKYPVSGASDKPEQNGTWKPIGDLARRLVEKAVRRE